MFSLLRNTAISSCSGLVAFDLLRPVAGDFTQLRGRKRALKQGLTRQQKLERRLKREEREAARKQYTFMERINIRRMRNLCRSYQVVKELKQGLTRQQKLERRLKREEREAARKQYTFMERINIRRMRNLLSPSQQFPGRLCREDEANLPDKPLTNIFIRSKVKTQFYSVAEALARHRELQQPSIYNNPNAPIRLRLELNMTRRDRLCMVTKMVSNSDEIVPVPYPFKHTEKRTILAFVNDPKLQEIAVESGAEIALGQDVVKKIIKGQFRTDDYDFCVAHTDMSSYILPLRGILRTKFPTRANGGLGEDLPDLIQKFKSGIKLAIKGDPVYPIWGLSDAVVGR
ncbi:hypothetical protein COOONC_26352, partial [Cooperia oncophora]